MDGVLEGFAPMDIAIVRAGRGGSDYRCESRRMLEAFLESGERAISRPMSSAALQRYARRLVYYRRKYSDEFGGIGISRNGGRLTLYLDDGQGSGQADDPLGEIFDALVSLPIGES